MKGRYMRLTNEMLKKFLVLKDQEKIVEAELKIIKDIIKEHGGGVTKEYIAICQDKEKRQLASIATFEQLLGPAYLEQNGLITTICYKEVKVAKRTLKL